MKELEKYLEEEFAMLDRSIVATPKTDEALERFANANHGCNDFLLMQMSKNYGYKIALLNIQELLTAKTK
jgi:hypothetical protein|tara:strand:+ start:1390 stop:1599 length:210 start_codon:yes stop_codon:yes gene_type:complete